MSSECESGALFREGSRVLLVGSSGSGKSAFIERCLKQKSEIFEIAPSQIIVCSPNSSAELSASLSEITDIPIEYRTSLPDEEQLLPHTVLIIDDLLAVGGRDFEHICEQVLVYFCRKCHHHKIYAFVSSQLLFPNSKAFRAISLNANYMVVFKSHRNVQQLKYLSQQLFGNGKFLLNVYEDALSNSKFGYIFLDLHPLTDSNLKIKTNVLGEDISKPCVVYKASIQ